MLFYGMKLMCSGMQHQSSLIDLLPFSNRGQALCYLHSSFVHCEPTRKALILPNKKDQDIVASGANSLGKRDFKWRKMFF